MAGTTGDLVEGFDGDDPRRYACQTAFTMEGSQGLHFGKLNATGGPVVQKGDPEDMILRVGDVESLSSGNGVRYPDTHFEFEVEFVLGLECG